VFAGIQEVPEPIWPIGSKFVSLAPTRILISSPDITTRGPIAWAPEFSILSATGTVAFPGASSLFE
jgi:hypothetical protein